METRSPKILACMNTKGGVGKTTSTVSIAHAVAAHGGSVLVVDLDHQSNATDLLEPESGEFALDRSVYDLTAAGMQGAYKGCNFPSAWCTYEPIAQSGGILNVIPGDPQFLDGHILECGVESLSTGLAGVENDYDLVLLDCPPSTGPVVQSGMIAASHVLLITESKHLALRSFGRTISFLQEVSLATGRPIEPTGILVTKYNHRKTEDREKLSVLKKRHSDILLPVRIPDRTAIDAAHSRHVPVDLLNTPQSRLVATAYLATALNVLKHMGIENQALIDSMESSLSMKGTQVA